VSAQLKSKAKQVRRFLLSVPGPVQIICSAVAAFIGLSLLLAYVWFGGQATVGLRDLLVGVGCLSFPLLPFLASRMLRLVVLGLGVAMVLPYTIEVVRQFGALNAYALMPVLALVAGLALGLLPFERLHAAT
jgi:hypothetical protein